MELIWKLRQQQFVHFFFLTAEGSRALNKMNPYPFFSGLLLTACSWEQDSPERSLGWGHSLAEFHAAVLSPSSCEMGRGTEVQPAPSARRRQQPDPQFSLVS